MPGSASVRHIDAVTPEPANTPVRLFPSISESLYDLSSVGAAATSQPVRDVLALAHREMTMWQRLMPRRLEGNDLLAALLRLHRLAFEAERGALFDRADFYWTEFANLLPIAWASTQAWPTSEIKAAFGREIVFDAHRAFYSAFAEASGPVSQRADWHLGRVLASLPYADLPRDDERAMALEPVIARTHKRLDANEVNAADTLSAALLARFPDDLQSQRLRITVEFRMALAGGDQSPALTASRLERSIARMAALRERFDDHADVYEAIAILHLSRAIALANANTLSEALVELAKAEANNPSLAELPETKSKVSALMRGLQTRIAEIEREIASRPNATLNAEGRRMQYEARRGFGAAGEWTSSDECRSVVAGRARGHARTLWRDIGLDSALWSNERGDALMTALTSVLQSNPASRLDLIASWREAALRHGLQSLDVETVIGWLERRTGARGASPAAALPTISVVATEKRRGSENLVDWLTGRAAARVRLQLLAVALLALVAAGLGARETYRAQARNRAWAALQAATTTSARVDAAERFFGVGRPVREAPSRESDAWQVYSKAIVQALADSETAGGPETVKRLQRYADTARRVGRN